MKMPAYNFEIQPAGKISGLFLEKGISDFASAVEFIRQLPYARNSSKTDTAIVFRENCGTCSTKHATLAILAEENQAENIQLILGIYRMNKQNTPGIGNTLEETGLDFIPEAHNYLRIGGEILDCTGISSSGNSFEDELLEEIEIQSGQVSDFKIKFHREFLARWIIENKISFTLDEIWEIREDCIRSISEK